MRLRTLAAAVIGIAVPIGLALAVYLSSPAPIEANAVSLPASALAQGNPRALEDHSKHGGRKHHAKGEHEHSDGTTPASGAGTGTTDDHGGSSGGGETSGSTSGGSGSDDGSSSGSGGGSHDSGGDD